MENSITFRVYGRYALFTDPLTRTGGEKMSLLLPTQQALKGIIESVYWKPTLRWYTDAVRIMQPIRTESKGMRPLHYGKLDSNLAIYNYLSDVEYIVKAHFERNPYRPDLESDFNENKHYFIAKRSLKKGGRRDIFLGTRECAAYVEPCAFEDGTGAYDTVEEMEFGLQFFGFSYPDENGCGELRALFWRPKMVNGVVTFCRPESCPISRVLHTYDQKSFTFGKNFSGVEEQSLLDGYEEAQV